MLNCIQEMQLDCEMFSIDLSEQFCDDNTKRTGYVIDKFKKIGDSAGTALSEGAIQPLQTKILERHHLMLGQVLPSRLEEIGTGIDLLILDTMHILPGEVLDFIAAFPYLSPDAIVVLHDTIWHYRLRRDGFATSTLFQTVTADKFLNLQKQYPNIAAFQLNEDTPKYMTDVVTGLMLTWSYMPDVQHLKQYEELIGKHYSAQCLEIYKQAVFEATDPHWVSDGSLLRDLVSDLEISLFTDYDHILLYGKRERGQLFYRYAKEQGIKIDGFVISDGRPEMDSFQGLPVYTYSKIPFSKDETLIIQTCGAKEVEDQLRKSDYHWLKLPGGIWREA